MSEEIALMKTLQVEASRMGARLFRQNVGKAWIGESKRFSKPEKISVMPGDVLVKSARLFSAGIKGMSDLGGWTPVKITEEMVGQTIAVYTQVEVKDGAKTSDEQENWIAAVLRAGGLAGIARNISDLTDIITARSRSNP